MTISDFGKVTLFALLLVYAAGFILWCARFMLQIDLTSDSSRQRELKSEYNWRGAGMMFALAGGLVMMFWLASFELAEGNPTAKLLSNWSKAQQALSGVYNALGDNARQKFTDPNSIKVQAWSDPGKEINNLLGSLESLKLDDEKSWTKANGVVETCNRAMLIAVAKVRLTDLQTDICQTSFLHMDKTQADDVVKFGGLFLVIILMSVYPVLSLRKLLGKEDGWRHWIIVGICGGLCVGNALAGRVFTQTIVAWVMTLLAIGCAVGLFGWLEKASVLRLNAAKVALTGVIVGCISCAYVALVSQLPNLQNSNFDGSAILLWLLGAVSASATLEHELSKQKSNAG